MPDILVRGLDVRIVKRLKAQARRNGRSLQREAKLLLEQGAQAGPEEVAVILEHWHKRFAGRHFTSSADLIREDRER